jgi:hypothetical protein
MVAVGLLFLGWVLFFLPKDEGATVVTDSNHCPVCGKELPPIALSTGECPYCLLKKGGRGRALGGVASEPRRFLFPAVLIAVFLGLAGTHAVLFFRSRRREVEQEEPLCYFKCPGCKRKLRYPARQAGNLGRCPTCRKPVRFPASA